MSNLIKHAERELKLAGLYDKESDYGGMMADAVMKIVRIFSQEGHSGASAGQCIGILERLLRFKTLKPIDSNAEFWMKVSDEHAHTAACWQSTRDPSYFSEDGGKTFYWLDDPEKKNFPNRFIR